MTGPAPLGFASSLAKEGAAAGLAVGAEEGPGAGPGLGIGVVAGVGASFSETIEAFRGSAGSIFAVSIPTAYFITRYT